MTNTTDGLTEPHPLTLIRHGGFYGGHLQGYCSISYNALRALLGPPHLEDGDKTHVEWTFLCLDGTTCNVYDYKEPVDPRAQPTAKTTFHIGGINPQALDAFHRLTGIWPESAYAPYVSGG